MRMRHGVGEPPQWTERESLMTDALPGRRGRDQAGARGPGFTKLVGAEVVSIEPGVVVMALDRRPEVLQQNGLFHGGAIAYLIDNATTAAAGTLIDRTTRTVITAEYKINLVAPSIGDRLTCRAEVVKPGRRSPWSRRRFSAASRATRSWSRSRSRPSRIWTGRARSDLQARSAARIAIG